VVPYRLLRPWLLLDWVYRLTDVARLELQQQRDIAHFTRKVRSLLGFFLCSS
jgi:hypothetical protein